ncbi:hypothetical protein PROFUN_09423 [Planoprotostelium fungivorum]|uniref:Integrator complex subunit 14 n=1 Tax=Planoprotostelium fungivorum TaxID=1890364 RepID=A0A2P6NHG1_9EUKA|nr:hypothetical protein PROFUN_09423 [Planoprotostelium fungivorum]
MPTILILDSSLSCGRLCEPSGSIPSRRDNLESRKELMQRGVLHFLELLSGHGRQTADGSIELERTALMTFSSQGQLLIPFTTDYNRLKSALYDIPLEDRTAAEGGIERAIELCDREKSECQLVIVTDGDHALSKSIPFGKNKRLHAIIVSSNEEERNTSTEEMDVDIESSYVSVGQTNEPTPFSLTSLTTQNNGTHHRIYTNQAQPSSVLKSTFDHIIHRYYSPINISVHFGRLDCNYILLPVRDRTQLSQLFGGEVKLSITHSVHTDSVFRGDTRFSIIGFLPSKKIGGYPIVDRFMLVPTEEHRENTFHLMLYQTIRSKRQYPVVRLSEGKYAYLHPLVNTSGMGVSLIEVIDDSRIERRDNWLAQMVSIGVLPLVHSVHSLPFPPSTTDSGDDHLYTFVTGVQREIQEAMEEVIRWIEEGAYQHYQLITSKLEDMKKMSNDHHLSLFPPIESVLERTIKEGPSIEDQNRLQDLLQMLRKSSTGQTSGRSSPVMVVEGRSGAGAIEVVPQVQVQQVQVPAVVAATETKKSNAMRVDNLLN